MAIATESTLSLLRQLGTYIKVSLPDIAQYMYKQGSAVECAYATTNTYRRSAGEKAERVPNAFKEGMTLPATVQWKAASDKEVAGLKNNKVYTLLPKSSVPRGHKTIGSSWFFIIKTNKSKEGRIVELRWGQGLGHDCGGMFAPVCRL